MKIKFVPMDIEVEADSSKSLLDIAKDNGIQIKSVCGGTPSCAECKIQIKEGEYNVLPPSDREISLIGTAHFVDRSRLSCQLRCFGDVTIDMNEQIEKQTSGTSTKRPRGKAQKGEGEESHAVEGSILLGGNDLEIFGTTGEMGIDRTNERRAVQVFDEDETRRALEQIRRKRAQQEKRNNEDDDEYVKKLKNRDRKYESYGSGDDDEDGDNKKSGRDNRKAKGNRNNRSNNPKNKRGGKPNHRNKKASGGGDAKAEGRNESSKNRGPRKNNRNRSRKPKSSD